ncbi:MAG TPA: polysaccharide deacetylase family protein [Fimbriimonas sp.]
MTSTRRSPSVALLALLLVATGCQTEEPARTVSQAAKPAPPAVAEVEPEPVFQEIAFRSVVKRTPVIMYHDVVPERTKDTQWFDVTRQEFEDQMAWIRDQGITPITMNELYRHLTLGEEIPEKSLVLSFDDNYEGFKEIAWPILQKYSYPAAMFVHTGFVGDRKTGRPKMGWEDLRELSRHPLFEIGAHTVTHPEDMRTLPPEKQFKEMKDSKDALERQLKIKVPFLAYPNGKNDRKTQAEAKKAGFLMAFSIDNGLAEESPSILNVNRYIHTRLKKAWDDRDRAAMGAPAGLYLQDVRDNPVKVVKAKHGRAKIIMVQGGQPQSLTSATRTGVLDFVKRAEGVAGVNGGFFVMSELRGKDNTMLGPCKTSDLPVMIPDQERSRWPKLRNRPMVLWGPTRFAILPYQPEIMNSEESFRTFMPDMTDAFLAGVWLVRNGVPRAKAEMNSFASKDIQDARRRAFFGVMADGSFVIGASKNSVSSERLAEAAASSGVAEAVLLDSGFSTSLVYDGQILASGHSTEKLPSRPVPHAIVLKGSLAAEKEEKVREDSVAQQEGRSRRKS